MKLNYRRTILIGLAFMSISAFWQMYDNIIPLILKDTFALGETLTGMIMAGDNVLAIFLLPVFGSISDRTQTRIGKRMPFVVIGTILASIALMVLSVADRQVNLVFFVVTLFVLLLAMGSYRSPAVALMPDLTPNRLRSKGNAVINLMGAVGGVYTLVMIKLLVGVGQPVDYLPLFISIMAIMIVGVGICFFTINEKRAAIKVKAEVDEYERLTGEKLSGDGSEGQEDDRSAVKDVGTKDGRRDRSAVSGQSTVTTDRSVADGQSTGAMDKSVRRSMVFLLASIFLWFTAYNAVTTAFSRYAGEVWQLEGGGFADCLLVATIASIISFIPIGHIASRVGRKKTILAGIVLMTVCYAFAAFMGEFHPIMNVFFALIGVGWAAINVNSYPMIVEMSRGMDIGKYTGTYYVFSMAAQIFTPIFSGLLLEQISYRTLFPYAAVFSVLAFVTMTQVFHGDSKPLKKKGALEHFDVED
ncbi:MAG: MFS transporter [Lachnospiraceae bacterium]|jgi:MFS family permease|nr:MFS transporter [Lachnospiraceae bacterium]